MVGVVLLGVTQVLVVLDGTVMSIALPSISQGLHLATARASYPTDLLPGLPILGLGTGLVFPTASITAMRDVAGGQAGLASGPVLPTAHKVGAALGVAVCSAVATAAEHTTAGGGFAAGYRHSTAVAAAIAAALAVGALLAVALLRPAPGVTAAVP